MKVGLSFSRCVKDLVEGSVHIDDILVVIARTDFDPTDDEQWASIWNGYNSLNPEWYGLDEQETRKTTLELWNRGLLHQPRKFGAYPRRRPEYWLETVLVSADLEHNHAAREAWEQFQVIAGLANVDMDKEYR